MVNHSMRKLCPNLDKEDGLEIVLEVPIPEEMLNQMGSNAALRWHNMRNLMRARRTANKFVTAVSNSASPAAAANFASNEQFMLLLKLVAATFIPYQVQLDHTITRPIKDGTIEHIVRDAQLRAHPDTYLACLLSCYSCT